MIDATNDLAAADRAELIERTEIERGPALCLRCGGLGLVRAWLSSGRLNGYGECQACAGTGYRAVAGNN